MKLTKSKLISITKKGLTDLDYKEFKDTVTGAQGLYIKVLENGLYLTLGLTISKFYDCRFTASFYLSKVTAWGATWGDTPLDSYERIGHFLTQNERELLLNSTERKGSDAWWFMDDDNALDKFLETIKITEPRFLEQPDLFNRIINSKTVNELAACSREIIALINAGGHIQYNSLFKPDKPIDDIPTEWFQASEQVLIKNGRILNKNTVRFFAADAYRQNSLPLASANG